MSNKKPLVICITGPDGSGKSTLISNIVAELSNATEVTIWDALHTDGVILFDTKKDIDKYLCILSPNARLLFLAHALQYAMDKALSSSADIILVNGYYYKYFSSEKVLGADQTLIDALITMLPIPDKTFTLTVSPEIRATRKKQLSRYECGCREATLKHFIDFQNKTQLIFETYIQPSWYELNAEDSPSILKEKIFKIILQ